MLNKVFLIGRLGRDPELRSTASGQPVGNFSVATSRRWRDNDGNRQEQTEWHQIVAWGRRAEAAAQYLTRGRLVHIEGHLKTSSWEDRQSGEKKFRTEVVCDNFTMLGGRFDGGSMIEHREESGGRAGEQPQGGKPGPEDDDIPF